MRPSIAARLERDDGDGDDGRERDQRDDKRRRRPAKIAALDEPVEPPAEWRADALLAVPSRAFANGGQ